jgi:hypothetical protein
MTPDELKNELQCDSFSRMELPEETCFSTGRRMWLFDFWIRAPSVGDPLRLVVSRHVGMKITRKQTFFLVARRATPGIKFRIELHYLIKIM